MGRCVPPCARGRRALPHIGGAASFAHGPSNLPHAPPQQTAFAETKPWIVLRLDCIDVFACFLCALLFSSHAPQQTAFAETKPWTVSTAHLMDRRYADKIDRVTRLQVAVVRGLHWSGTPTFVVRCCFVLCTSLVRSWLVPCLSVARSSPDTGRLVLIDDAGDIQGVLDTFSRARRRSAVRARRRG